MNQNEKQPWTLEQLGWALLFLLTPFIIGGFFVYANQFHHDHPGKTAMEAATKVCAPYKVTYLSEPVSGMDGMFYVGEVERNLECSDGSKHTTSRYKLSSPAFGKPSR